MKKNSKFYDSPTKIGICVLPGGVMPERQSIEAVGYDVSIRAIVSPFEMDKDNPHLRRTIFNFKSIPDDPRTASRIHHIGDELVYRMEPKESVLVGIGFMTSMPSGIFFWIAPRSGLAGKWGITITNAPGVVDPDYRGEAGVLVYNTRERECFDLKGGMRIAQIIFQSAIFPLFNEVLDYNDLSKTNRDSGGFGSTGL